MDYTRWTWRLLCDILAMARANRTFALAGAMLLLLLVGAVADLHLQASAVEAQAEAEQALPKA